MSYIQMDGTVSVINMHEAKTHLSAIVEEVKRLGKPVIIAKAGKPQVKITPIDETKTKRVMGTMKGKIQIPDDFDTVLNPQIEQIFLGENVGKPS